MLNSHPRPPPPRQPPTTLFDFQAETIDGEVVSLSKYQTTTRVQLVVNVASGTMWWSNGEATEPVFGWCSRRCGLHAEGALPHSGRS